MDTTLVYKTLSKLHTNPNISHNYSLNRFPIDFLQNFQFFLYRACFFFPDLFSRIRRKLVSKLFPRGDRVSRRPSFSKYQKRLLPLRFPRTSSAHEESAHFSFARFFHRQEDRNSSGNQAARDEISPRRGEERPMQSVLLRRTPRFRTFAPPLPLFSREITVKERPELERGRKPLVEEDFPLFESWSLPRNGLEPLRARRLPVSDRGDGTRFKEAQVGR